jgi:hypothetical protein
LARKKVVDRLSVNAEDAADPNRIQSPVVDQPPDRLRVHAELIRNLANADEPGSFAWCRHDDGQALHVLRSRASAVRTGHGGTACRERRQRNGDEQSAHAPL